ncbi:hypothetical protein G9A89_023540 [Geosiphon pyriformis]|nr:hypothetical protein G9A89_023540 [Geosiphon pyriformis]
MPPSRSKHVAILGGGISGLATAWHLARSSPSTKITLLEGANRLGGWIQTKRVGDRQLLFELGPRTLRPSGLSGLATLDMISELSSISSIIAISSSHLTAKNRFIYYPDRLNKIPSSLFGGITSLFSLPVMQGVISGLLREPFVQTKHLDDESIHSFISRRLDQRLSDNMISAVIHGIYAGDVTKLSLRSTLPFLYYAERKHGSIFKGVIKGRNQLIPYSQQDQLLQMTAKKNPELLDRIKKFSLYSFRDGVEELTRAIEKDLVAKMNVAIKIGQQVKSLTFENGLQVHTNQENFFVDHVISTIPSHELHKILENSTILPKLPHLNYNPSVTVAVVNLAYKRSNLLPVEGFGYLLPRSTPNNPYHALGVVFDSCAMPDQDSDAFPNLTKVTVMLGGHYYDDFHVKIPDEDELLLQAREILQNHLNIIATPEDSLVSVQKKCIPQYYVGHYQRMQELHMGIKQGIYKGKLSVTGASYWGVSINDCVLNARKLAESLAKKFSSEKEGNGDLVITGLERVEDTSED